MSAVALNAQSIKVLYQGVALNNNDTVFTPTAGHGEDVDTYFGYQNMTGSPIEFCVLKQEIFKPEEADMMFCIGSCYSGESSNTLTMEANETVADHDMLGLHVIYSGSSQPAFVKYTFSRTDNQGDEVSFYIAYGTSSAVREADMVKALYAYPNPAVRNVNIEYVAPNSNSSLVVKNLAGKEVYRTAVGAAGCKQIDVSSLSPGVYFYGIESEGKMVCTKKLLIK